MMAALSLLGAAVVLPAPTAASVSSAPQLGITWAERGGPVRASAAPGSSVQFALQWGVSNSSQAPAADSVLAASFWFGGVVSNVTAPYPCNTSAAGQLICDLGALGIGQWSSLVVFHVAVPAAAIAGPLSYFIGGRDGFANGPESFGRIEVDAGAIIPSPTVQGCMLVNRETVRWSGIGGAAANSGCPADKPIVFVNGDGRDPPGGDPSAGAFPAFIGKGTIGTLEVPINGAACCEGGGGDLFVNPKPGAGIPSGCQGTGEKVPTADGPGGTSGISGYMLLWWHYYNPYSPTLNPYGCNHNPNCTSVLGEGTRGGYCSPLGLCATAGSPTALC
jgi:hypothetical protein